ncbi:substrate-binding domain-containing protein [Methylobacterium sp. J-078]|uniref:substrate-binding domain-containing protein n=1 Tax=Methylobacterium sp. J-078 TaxID=2836657 RepID=UPI001FBBE834|nr:substrate-binding domain-containing protein [Methylobacterium sp. J-078]MCJ2046673.1 substrate-binding domain-containing protein [Methylobacterium sp. J-078]
MERVTDRLGVIVSGGFWEPYQALLPEFVRDTGIAVETLSGASQGTGPKTIGWQLEHGARIDVVILSREGLDELAAGGRIRQGSDTPLARAALAAAVRLGAPKPDIHTRDAFRQTLLDAGTVVMPGSTSGLFVRDAVFPQLGIADRVRAKVLPRGTDSTAALAAGEADLALGPVSELVGQPGIELVGPLPDAVQLVQVFTAAIVDTAHRIAEARRLIAFLASPRAAAAIRRFGMEPAGASAKSA